VLQLYKQKCKVVSLNLAHPVGPTNFYHVTPLGARGVSAQASWVWV